MSHVPMSGAVVRHCAAAELDVATFHDLLRLRVDVFVVEQRCPYPELDGHDIDPGTEHWWIEVDGHVVATLRVLTGPRIGRVVTAADHRGVGHAATLMRAALASVDQHHCEAIRLEAQAVLQGWYAAFGFAQDGDAYTEDGILHVPMHRLPKSR